ncbi:MAG: hypothetical protein K0S99_3663, partial [Thermomicrobiales bacterium]|nr:hypothetical protein [Thermomicrobiales bacterium]
MNCPRRGISTVTLPQFGVNTLFGPWLRPKVGHERGGERGRILPGLS